MGHTFENLELYGNVLESLCSAKRKEQGAHSDHSHGIQQMWIWAKYHQALLCHLLISQQEGAMGHGTG